MSFNIHVGDIIFISDGGGGHLYLILTEPLKDQVIIVSFTRAPYCPDNTLVFNHNDCSLFDQPTAVNYQLARQIKVTSIISELTQSSVGLPHKGNHQAILSRVISGAFQSSFISNEIKAALKKQYPNKSFP